MVITGLSSRKFYSETVIMLERLKAWGTSGLKLRFTAFRGRWGPVSDMVCERQHPCVVP